MQESIKKITKTIWNNFKYKKALFAVSSLWLWHATRTLEIIKFYLNKDFEIKLISSGNAFNFLKEELKDYKKIEFIEKEDYPALERWNWIMFYVYLIFDLLKTWKIIKQENKFIKNLWYDFDFIFSDGKYWIYNKKIKSFLLSHQISFIMPKWLAIFQKISDYFNYKYFKNFDIVFIPDFEDIKKSLAWKLSHNQILKKLNYIYIWTLTSYFPLKKKSENIIDYYFIISWYLVEYKNSFVNKLIEQAKKLDWKKIFILWDNSKKTIKFLEEFNIKIYSSVKKEERLDFFSRANIIISRAGYTTVMDLYANNKKAVLFPTPNQTEQEYLAEYLWQKGLFINWWEWNFDLVELIKKIW